MSASIERTPAERASGPPAGSWSCPFPDERSGWAVRAVLLYTTTETGSWDHGGQIVWGRNNRGVDVRDAARVGAGQRQDRLRQHLLGPSGGDRRGHAPLGRSGGRASRRQDGRQE